MSEVLYRGYFSDDYELMCNWQWDTRDDTLEISVWNYNMDTMGSIYTTPALYDGISKMVVQIMENVKIKRITGNMATLSLTQMPPLEKQRQIAADVMTLLSNNIIRWEVRISTKLQNSLYRQSWICKQNVLSMLDMAAITIVKESRKYEMPEQYEMPEHLEARVNTWRTKMEECQASRASLGARCLKQKELEEIVSNITNKKRRIV